MAGSGADLSATDGRRLPIGLGEQEGGGAGRAVGGRHRRTWFFGTSTFLCTGTRLFDLDSEVRVTGTRYRDTGLQGYRVTVIQGYRDTGTGLQGCSDTGTRGTRDLRQGGFDSDSSSLAHGGQDSSVLGRTGLGLRTPPGGRPVFGGKDVVERLNCE